MYAHVFFALGEKCYMNARDLLLEAIRIDPEFSAAYRDLGEIYLINWEPERALEYLSTAARLEPENAEYRARRSLALLRSGRARDAFEEVHTALRIAPDDYQVLNTVGMVLLFGGELDEAEKLLRRALEQFPTYEYFQRQLTNCLRERDDRASRTAQGKPYTPLVRRQRGRKRFFDESRSDEAPGRKWRSRLS
jgi:tetratricopeptide (TPR) repeat protein